jgi:hypothetical protein
MRKHTDLWEKVKPLPEADQAKILAFIFAYCESNPKATFFQAVRDAVKYYGKKPETLTTE